MLASFATQLRFTLEDVVGDHILDRSWSLAQLSVKHGGLGIRDPVLHAPAAFLGSLGQTQGLYVKIDPDFDSLDGCGGLFKSKTEADLRQHIMEAASLDWGAVPHTQKDLSSMIDGALQFQIREQQAHDRFFCAHMALSTLPGAGAFLTAPPVEDGREIETPLFKVSLKRRLRAPVFDAEGPCPLCGDIMDIWGDHALTNSSTSYVLQNTTNITTYTYKR